MLILIIPFLLFSAAVSLSRLTKLRPEQSLMTIVCSIITLLLTAGLFGALKFGLYACCALLAVLLVYLPVAFIRDKTKQIEFEIGKYLTPGMAVFLLSSTLYSIASWGSVLCFTDDAVHWAVSTLYMLRTGELFAGIQTLGVPVLNYFITSLTGYSEHILIAGRWMFLWAAFCLPLSFIKWDKWYKALIYAVMCYMICGTISTLPKIYMDLPMGVLTGALCAYWALSPRNLKRYPVMLAALIVLCQIKYISGLLLAILVLVFIIVYESVAARQDRISRPDKRNITALLLLSLSILVGAAISIASCGHLINIFAGGVKFNTSASAVVLNMPQSTIYFAILCMVFLVAGIVLLYIRGGRSHASKSLKAFTNVAFILSAVLGLGLLAFILRNMLVGMPEDNQKFLFRYYNEFWVKGFWGKSIKMLVLMLMAFSGFTTALCLNKSCRAQFLSQTAATVAMFLVYGASIGISYLYAFLPYERQIMAEFHRYLGTGVVFVATWLTGYIALSQGCWIKEKLCSLVLSAAIMLLLIDDAPTPGDTVLAPLSSSMLPFKYGIRPEISEHSQTLLNNTTQDDAIYVVSLISENNDEVRCKLHEVFMKYEVTPRTVHWLRFDFMWDEFDSTIRSGDIDYLYIHSTTDSFEDIYGYLFEQSSPPENNVLYRVDTAGDQLLCPVN